MTNTCITAQNATETEVHKWTAFASDLGFPIFPSKFPPIYLDTTLGNGRQFIFDGIVNDQKGFIVGVRYIQDLGCVTLTVFND